MRRGRISFPFLVTIVGEVGTSGLSGAKALREVRLVPEVLVKADRLTGSVIGTSDERRALHSGLFQPAVRRVHDMHQAALFGKVLPARTAFASSATVRSIVRKQCSRDTNDLPLQDNARDKCSSQ